MLANEVTAALDGGIQFIDVAQPLPAYLSSDEPDDERVFWKASGHDTLDGCDQAIRRSSGRRAPEAISARA
ncbi:hypothetical protein [Methylobacterium planeticum]|uniref:Uncharacterized protein n=1 Tax=Methylobacterium planeticum TaxID=2615211 RepID=A0A6N6MN12_9HYPH|nr:hypothetical protein [Methylobacterium planeticum]KAB1071523.1 hypothetical protein F6X51_19640 [Methylobacterium planeticum]